MEAWARAPRTLTDARGALARGETTAATLVEESLRAAQEYAACNALAHLDAERARADAERCDAESCRGAALGPLHGLPITVKDLFSVDGMPTRGGTRAALPDLGGEARAVARLRRAGAIVIGKTNLHEIAAGVSGENAATGDVCNPYDLARQAGGSSSGSAAAVASGIGLASLGSDTGASIRIPAALCGVVGFKPSYGLVPLDGALPLSWSCDHAGPLARSVDDAHLLSEVLAAQPLALRPIGACAPTRLGFPQRYLAGWLGASVRAAFEALIARLGDCGVTIVEVDAPSMEESLPLYGIIRGAEAAFVHRAALAREPENFSPAVRERLLQGRAVSAQAYFEAQRGRQTIEREIAERLMSVDAWILPSAPLPAPLRGAEMVALERGLTEHRIAFVRLTLPFNLARVPALSIPFAREAGLPLGVQLVGSRGADARVLEIGRWLESFSSGSALA